MATPAGFRDSWRTVRGLRLHAPLARVLAAEPFRHWYTDQGLPSSRLLVSSFLLMDPMLTIRTRSVPYWALFGTQPSLDRLTGYLSGTSAYDDIRLTSSRTARDPSRCTRTAIPGISVPLPASITSCPACPARPRRRRSAGPPLAATWPATRRPTTRRSSSARSAPRSGKDSWPCSSMSASTRSSNGFSWL